MDVSPFKIAHWMNARKFTAAQLAQRAGMAGPELAELLGGGPVRAVPQGTADALAAALRVEAGQLAADPGVDLTVLTQDADELAATRRPIDRDGIHFYNYYSMAAPPGRVAPVILDILCPADRLPALNNGHLEPAITVNIGPGDIHGRWGTELSEATWQVLHADPASWIVGDSYVEPSYCPHSYSLAGSRPARIVSYTGQANLSPLVEEANSWSAPAFQRWLDALDGMQSGGPPALLQLLLARRGHTVQTASAATGVDLLDAVQTQNTAVLRTVGAAIGLDYRLLLGPQCRRDEVGKTCLTMRESHESARQFRGYQVADMAAAPHLPDLSGLFMKVGGDSGGELLDQAEIHYLVVAGELSLQWTAADGTTAEAKLGTDGSAWVGPFVAHRWFGDGAVLKFGSGSHVGYLDLVEITNTYAPAATARRGRRDATGWGYDG